MSIQIILPDHNEVFKRISFGVETTKTQLDEVLQRSSALIEATLKTLILQETHGTGLTASSIETRKEDELVYGIGSYTRGNILRFLDAGTGLFRSGKTIIIRPVARQALHFFVKETGDEVFAAYCVVKGIIPFEFMTRAIQTHLGDIDEITKETIKI